MHTRYKYYPLTISLLAVFILSYLFIWENYHLQNAIEPIPQNHDTTLIKPAELNQTDNNPTEQIIIKPGSYRVSRHRYKQSNIEERIEVDSNQIKFLNDLAFIHPADLWVSQSVNHFPKKNWPLPDTWDIPAAQSELTGQFQQAAEAGVSDVLTFATNPLRWESNDWINAAIVASGTLLLYSLDEQIYNSLTNGNQPSNSDAVKFGNFYGETSTTQYTALGIEAYGFICNDKKAIQLGLEIFESYLLANNLTGLLKYSLGRSRPYEDHGPYEFRMFDRAKRFCALPSGHSTLAFSMSTILASYAEDTQLKILIYIPAFITAFSRIHENYHWASDVFLGAAIGYFAGRFITSRHNPIKSEGIEFGFDKEGRPGFKFHF